MRGGRRVRSAEKAIAGSAADGRTDRGRAVAPAEVRQTRRSGSRRRRVATNLASAAAARSTRCATALAKRSDAMRDFSETLPISLAVSRRARATCTSTTRGSVWRARRRRRPTPICGTTRNRRARSRRSSRGVRDDVELIDGLSERVTDLETLFELAREESDDSVEGEIADGWRRSARSSIASSCARCSVASTTSATRSARSTPAPAAPTRRTGRRCCSACITRWAQNRGFEFEVDEIQEGQEAGIKSATFIVRGPLRVRQPRRRAGRAPADPHLAVRRQRPPPDRVRVARLRPRDRAGRGARDRSRATSGSTPTARPVRAVST